MRHIGIVSDCVETAVFVYGLHTCKDGAILPASTVRIRPWQASDSTSGTSQLQMEVAGGAVRILRPSFAEDSAYGQPLYCLPSLAMVSTVRPAGTKDADAAAGRTALGAATAGGAASALGQAQPGCTTPLQVEVRASLGSIGALGLNCSSQSSSRNGQGKANGCEEAEDGSVNQVFIGPQRTVPAASLVSDIIPLPSAALLYTCGAVRHTWACLVGDAEQISVPPMCREGPGLLEPAHINQWQQHTVRSMFSRAGGWSIVTASDASEVEHVESSPVLPDTMQDEDVGRVHVGKKSKASDGTSHSVAFVRGSAVIGAQSGPNSVRSYSQTCPTAGEGGLPTRPDEEGDSDCDSGDSLGSDSEDDRIVPTSASAPSAPTVKIAIGVGWRAAAQAQSTAVKSGVKRPLLMQAIRTSNNRALGFVPKLPSLAGPPSLVSSTVKRSSAAPAAQHHDVHASDDGDACAWIRKSRLGKWLSGSTVKQAPLAALHNLRLNTCPIAQTFPSAALAPAASVCLGPQYVEGRGWLMNPQATLSNLYSCAKPFANAGDGSAADNIKLPSAAASSFPHRPYPYSEGGYTAKDAAREAEEEEARYGRGGQGGCTDIDLGLVQERAKAAASSAARPSPLQDPPSVLLGTAMDEGGDAQGDAGRDDGPGAAPVRTAVPAVVKPALTASATASSAGSEEGALASFVASLGPNEAALKGKGVELKHLKAYLKLIARCPVTGSKGVLVERVLAHMLKT